MSKLNKTGREGTQLVHHFGKWHKRYTNLLKKVEQFEKEEHTEEEKRKFYGKVRAIKKDLQL